MPEPKFVEPAEGKSSRARGSVPAVDTPDVVASLAPDDDLADLFPAESPEQPTVAVSRFVEGQKVLIHILEDGFTANGRVWYRGQEIEYTIGDDAFKDTQDREGRSWLELSPADQMRRYGRAMFGEGPWPGGVYEHQQALAAERERNRKPPTIGKLSSAITRS
jgi:hypothetical protein